MRVSFIFAASLFFFCLPATSTYAEENKGFSLSNIFKIKKAEKEEFIAPPPPADQPIVLSGASGPAMPAVPTGDIKKEVILETELPAPASILNASNTSAPPPLKPVTVTYNPQIPFMSLVFQNGFQQNLEPSHIEILNNRINEISNGNYRGVIRIQSFSTRGHQTAMTRAQQVRKILIDRNFPLTSLDLQALPGRNEKNIIHVFLLGEL